MTRLDHLNLTVRNFEESKLWYARVFGFECVEEGTWKGAPWGVLRSGDSMLCIYEDPERKAPSKVSETLDQFHRIYHFALTIDDREKWEETLGREKLKITFGAAIAYPHSTSWYIEDPSGYEIEVVLWKDGAPRF